MRSRGCGIYAVEVEFEQSVVRLRVAWCVFRYV